MDALQAARFGDEIGHTCAMSGLLKGIVVGLVVTGAVLLATGATVATGGAAAVVIGGLIAGGAGGGLAGMNIGATYDSDPMGPINSGSPNTFLGMGKKKAARAVADTVACKSHSIKHIAQGSVDVFVNRFHAARRTDKTVCSAKIRDGQPDVFFGGPTGTYMEMEAEVPGWLVTSLKWAGWIGLGIATLGAAFVVGPFAAGVGAIVSYEAGEIGTKIGGDIGEHLGGARGKAWGEAIGGFVGSTAGGHIAGKVTGPVEAPSGPREGPVANEAPTAAREAPTAANDNVPAAREAPAAANDNVPAAREAPAAANDNVPGAREAPAAPNEAPAAPREAPATNEAPAAPREGPVANEAPAAPREATPAAPKEAAPEAAPELYGPKERPPQRPDTSDVKYGPDSKYQKANGDWDWPPDGGFDGPRTPQELQPGERIDRFGHEGGDYLSPEGTPFEQRALAPKSLNDDYHVYRVVKPFTVESGGIAPAFDQPGGGVQYKAPMKVQALLDGGYIVEVKP